MAEHSKSKDIGYHDEHFNREHKDVSDDIHIDPPIKVHADTAWVNSRVALDEYRSGDLECARRAQERAEQAYEACDDAVGRQSWSGSRTTHPGNHCQCRPESRVTIR